METRVLGSSGIVVGAIGLGCMGMSHGYDVGTAVESESIAVIHRALDIGVTLLDTSDVYGPHTNEELVGRALVGHRERAVLASCTPAALQRVTPSGRCGHAPSTPAVRVCTTRSRGIRRMSSRLRLDDM